jgi:hypothetical protein
MCHFEPAPLPAFQAPQSAVEFLGGSLVLLFVFLGALAFVNGPRSLGRRWRDDRGAVIVSIMVSLIPALCVTFAVSMVWLFLNPSSEAIKHWDVVQERMVAPPCTVDDLNAA